jgi:hypothetical protein
MGGGLLDVPPMMMPPPHAMRQDPRSVRRLAFIAFEFFF